MSGAPVVHDLAVIIVSTNEADWLRGCLPTVFDHAGALSLDVVVVDNQSTDDTVSLVEREFPRARTVVAENHGFSHGNNRGLMEVNARYVLFLNPDTEILNGTLAEMVARMDALPGVGIAGCRQVLPDGELHCTMRRFPNAVRQASEALFSERWPRHATWTGERVIDSTLYDQEFDADWTSGSFMLARMEAIQSGGFLDERFFIYSEETDFALRIRKAGWRVRHLPQVEIVHYVGKAGWKENVEAQYAYARILYAAKNFSSLHRLLFRAAVVLRYLLRYPLFATRDKSARRALGRGLRVALGLDKRPPYEPPPPVAVRPAPHNADAAISKH